MRRRWLTTVQQIHAYPHTDHSQGSTLKQRQFCYCATQHGTGQRRGGGGWGSWVHADDGQVGDGVRSAFRVLGFLAALGLVVVVGLLIGIRVQQHRFQQEAQRNKAAAMSQASADAEAFYRDLLDSAKTAVPTLETVQALGLRDLVKADPPLVEDGRVVVSFDAGKGYAASGFLEGSRGTVHLCYRAEVPVPASSGTSLVASNATTTTAAPILREVTCLASGGT